MAAPAHDDTPEWHGTAAWTNEMCGHSEATGGGTLDCVGGRHRRERRSMLRRSRRNPESREAFLSPGSLAMLLNRRYPRRSFLITR